MDIEKPSSSAAAPVRPYIPRAALSAQLDALSALVPQLREDCEDSGELMECFAVYADEVLDAAPAEHRPFVHERIDWIVAKYKMAPGDCSPEH